MLNKQRLIKVKDNRSDQFVIKMHHNILILSPH
jgi:hypothetical protein